MPGFSSHMRGDSIQADNILYGDHRRGISSVMPVRRPKTVRLGKNQRLVLEFLRDWKIKPPEGRYDMALVSDICNIYVQEPGSAIMKYIFYGSTAAEKVLDRLTARGLVNRRQRANNWMVYYSISKAGLDALN